jgi:hypothetical protein
MMRRKKMYLNVTIATSIKYGNYKQYLRAAQNLQKFVNKAAPHLEKLLDVPAEMDVRIRPIYKSKYTTMYGRYVHTGDRHIELDPRYGIKSAIQTFMHEMVHVEQFHSGALEYNTWDGQYRWKGVDTDNQSIAKNYQEYLELPWEKEAYSRQKELAIAICSMTEYDVTF